MNCQKQWMATIIFTSLVFSPLLKAKEPLVKIKIKSVKEKLKISGLDIIKSLPLYKKNFHYSGQTSFKYSCNKKIKGKKATMLASMSSLAGPISVNKEKYLGSIDIYHDSVNQKCDVVNTVGMEHYLSSLLSKEMNNSWPIEALKAQAIASRTYALFMMKKNETAKVNKYYDLENSEKHQVGGSLFDTNKKTFKATVSTKGIVLLNGKSAIGPAFFHAKCGGRTIKPEEVWQNPVEGYRSVNCPYCWRSGKKNWKRKIKVSKLKKFFSWLEENKHIENIKDKNNSLLRIPEDRKKKQKFRFYIGEKVEKIEKALVRRFFGRKLIPSNHFQAKLHNKSLAISGSGHGHGVGMCQIGALEMAKQGKTYKQILAHYYPAHRLEKIY